MFTVIAHPQLRGKTPVYFRNSMAISDQFHQHCASPPRHWAVAPRLAMSQWRKCHTTPLPGGTKLCRNIATPKQLHSGQPYPDSPATSRQRRRCHRQLPAKSPRHHHSIRTSGSQLLQPSPNRAGLSKDEELQLSWQVLFTVTKNP